MALMVTRIIQQGVDKSAFIKIHVLGYLSCYHDSLFFLEFSSLVITKEGSLMESHWTCYFGIILTLCKNLAVHAGSSSRSCARTRVRNHGCSIPKRNTRQHNELKQLKLNHGVGHISKLNQLNFLQKLKEVGGPLFS